VADDEVERRATAASIASVVDDSEGEYRDVDEEKRGWQGEMGVFAWVPPRRKRAEITAQRSTAARRALQKWTCPSRCLEYAVAAR
jgi:hypothetical protein